MALTYSLMSSSVAVAPSLRTMKALGSSPAVLSGLPTTAHSLTAGCSYSTSSISRGYTLCPLYLMRSFLRSVMKK